jgi:hypothetical protein
MSFEIADDDGASLGGKPAIYFPSGKLLSRHCETLGYACRVIGNARRADSQLKEKRYLIFVPLLGETRIVDESELMLPSQPSGGS